MTTEEIVNKINAAGFQVEVNDEGPDPFIEVDRENLIATAKFLKNDPDLNFDLLMCLSGLDWPEYFQVVYHLISTEYKHTITVKVRCLKDDPIIPSVSDIWRTAEWHEREAYDLVGIRFDGNRDLRRILLPEDWEGHPLQKDYVPPTSWHKIPLTNLGAESTNEGN
ncbi:NADH-quinone oxidoreductase subunit C [candidate division LCP-89 bacterium B3_LCP]|uniref:NADH-quinone oxidoreductase subunit C n=1 Tax=candidate division LCP-89 bacterium B3_LCP TaxID=2012998 RepID=A0A532V5S5_UNCL8|nr:MAG: NADH-quinone oxidoreductase subunit C [candidate division LCP-89 bacterium B3_LCP]